MIMRWAKVIYDRRKDATHNKKVCTTLKDNSFTAWHVMQHQGVNPRIHGCNGFLIAMELVFEE